MEPSASEFLRLNEFAGCPASRNNADISKLLYLMENGFKRDIINDPDFGYRNVFQEYVTRIDDCINGQSSGPDLSDVLDDMRWKAGSLPLTGKYWRQGTDSSCRERQKATRPMPMHG